MVSVYHLKSLHIIHRADTVKDSILPFFLFVRQLSSLSQPPPDQVTTGTPSWWIKESEPLGEHHRVQRELLVFQVWGNTTVINSDDLHVITQTGDKQWWSPCDNSDGLDLALPSACALLLLSFRGHFSLALLFLSLIFRFVYPPSLCQLR